MPVWISVFNIYGWIFLMVFPKYPIWSFDASINHKSLIENIFCFVFNRRLIWSCIDVNNPNNPALHLNKWNFTGINILCECVCSIFDGVYVQIISICLFFFKPISNQLATILPLFFAVAFILKMIKNWKTNFPISEWKHQKKTIHYNGI